MKILITYDISIRQPEVKQALLNIDFHDRWKFDNKLYHLPNTTLWHSNLLSAKRANDLFHEVINTLNEGQTPENIIKVQRFMAVEFTTWSGIEGQPHA